MYLIQKRIVDSDDTSVGINSEGHGVPFGFQLKGDIGSNILPLDPCDYGTNVFRRSDVPVALDVCYPGRRELVWWYWN